MTFADIVSRVSRRTNLYSSDALERIGEEVNERYRAVLSSVGLQTSVRETVTATTTIGNRYLEFAGCEKLYSVFDANVTPNNVLNEITFDEMRNWTGGTDPASDYAISRMGPTSVTILLDGEPGSAYEYSADAEVAAATLAASDEPAFAEKFHDLLIWGAWADELYKMEKIDLAKVKEAQFERRISELRLHIATSAYLDLYQGKHTHEVRRIV